MTTGADLLRDVAPEGADVLEAVVAAAWAGAGRAGATDLVASAARTCADVLGVHALTPPSDASGPAWDGDAPAVLAFAEQCCVDVASVTPEQRASFLSATGPAAGELAAALWVVDVVPRTRAALDALAGTAGPWPVAGPDTPAGDLWPALDDLVRVVPALDALDPVTTELVRLRGARAHDCRLCRSLRSRSALRAGATEADFDAVDRYADSSLPELARAALALCDAMVWTPGRIDPAVVDGLRATATPAQQVEVVLDVTRNALNKVAVALGADAPHVDEGVEIYDVRPDGTLVYGLDAD